MNSGPTAHRASDILSGGAAQSHSPQREEVQKGPLTGNDIQKEEPQSGAAARRERRRSGKSASAFKTISEVAEQLDVQQHVLRFWETKFSQIRPLKRGGGRRYYRPEDLALLTKIHHLLYTEGYTIKGVQKLLKEKGKAQLLNEAPAAENNNAPQSANSGDSYGQKGLTMRQRTALKAMLGELKDLRKMIASE